MLLLLLLLMTTTVFVQQLGAEAAGATSG